VRPLTVSYGERNSDAETTVFYIHIYSMSIKQIASSTVSERLETTGIIGSHAAT
jgi:hypothetical protein